MKKNVARMLSFLFHPLLLPSYLLLVVYQANINQAQMVSVRYKSFMLAFIFVSTFLLPVLFTLALWRLKLVKQFTMQQRNERFIPMAGMAIFYFFSFYQLQQLPVFPAFNLFLKGSTVLVLLAIVINYFYKISLHLLAWGGLTGAVTGIMFQTHQGLYFWLFSAILLSGLVASARIACQAHKTSQVYAGYLAGFFVMLGLFLM
jgi:hypothetical protein